MKLRKFLGALLALGALEGCSKIPGSCEQDADCARGHFCHTEQMQCFSNRYSALNILTLTESTVVGEGPIPVQARLELEPGARPIYPAQLNLTVTPVTGGAPTLLALDSTAEGTYGAEWTPPPGEGSYTFLVSHPEEWGPSSSARVTVDRTAPALSLQVPDAQPSAPTNGFTYADPMATSRPAWPRDQTVTVRVESDSADLDPTSVRVVVKGHAGGTNVTDLTVRPATPCTGKLYCGSVDVPLWRPGLEAFRGEFQLDVMAKDKVGNERSTSASIPVTRWKWAFDGASGPILSSPAIGEKGTLYFGTSGPNGKVLALNPEGTRKWEAQLGPVLTSPAVGNSELLYVGVTPSDGKGIMYALDTNGGTVSSCTLSSTTYILGPLVSAVTLAQIPIDATTSVETGIAYANPPSSASSGFNSGGFFMFQATHPDASKRCSMIIKVEQVHPGANIVAKGRDFYFGHQYDSTSEDGVDAPDTFELMSQRHNLGGAGWTGNPDFGRPSTGLLLSGLVLAEDDLLVGAAGSTSPAQGGLIALSASRGQFRWRFPTTFSGPGPVRNLTIGTGNTAFFGREVTTGSAALTAFDLTSQTPRVSAPNAGSFPGAPVLGSSGILYTASATGPAANVGEVSAWSANDLSPRWKLSDSVGRAHASPALDCARNPDGAPAEARVGVLYVPALDGRMYALIVDSPGLEKNAPWPKYQRDARNTGNTATPVTNCQ